MQVVHTTYGDNITKRARGVIVKKEHESIDIYECCPYKT
jgi:hypothetical protein